MEAAQHKIINILKTAGYVYVLCVCHLLLLLNFAGFFIKIFNFYSHVCMCMYVQIPKDT